MAETEGKVICQTPTPGKKPTHIAKWKYDLIRSKVLEIIPENAYGVEFTSLAGGVAALITKEQQQRLGSIPWYTTTVKLDMEVKGEIERVTGSNPQRLRRT